MQLMSDSNIDVTYLPSESKHVFYDNKSLISSLAAEGFLDIQQTGGSYTIMSKPSQIVFDIKEGPFKGTYNVRENVKYLYSSRKVDVYLFKRFVKDLDAKKITWNFDKNRKIHFTYVPEPFGHQMTMFEYINQNNQ